MSFTGLTSYVVERERVDARIDDALAQEVAEFRELARNGTDPATGQPFRSVDRMLEQSLRRNVPSSGESMLGIVDGEVRWVPGTEVDIEPENDADFVQAVAQVDASDPVRAQSFDSAELGVLRYVALPVGPLSTDTSTGVYVVAFDRDAEMAVVIDSHRRYVLVAAGSLVLVGVVGWTVAGQLLRPIRLLRETAERSTDTGLSERIPVEGNDDVTDLARTFNRMLDRLEAAFEAHRSVLDDAGHELRTPLTIVRGHLEVMDPSDPADVAETRTLILDEMDRMQRLVDDLVMLAKADRQDFVQRHRVDVGQLTDEIFDKVWPLRDDRTWRVDHRADDVQAELDAQRIMQAMLQLASNAVQYSGPGDEVAVGSAAGNGTVRLWVRDTGIGIHPADVDRIFERFARGGDIRRTEGSGLGLAIVRAIAEAHGGRVTVFSEPGTGSTFEIEVPRGRPAEEPTDERTVGSDRPVDGGRNERDLDRRG